MRWRTRLDRVIHNYIRIAYACAVSTHLHLPAIVLRAGILALLLLGACVKPMLAAVCDVHAIGHALFVADANAPKVEHDPGREHEVDRDHARGKHGSLHGYDDSGAYAHLVAEVILPEAGVAQAHMPLPVDVSLPLKRIGAPFRPPIV